MAPCVASSAAIDQRLSPPTGQGFYAGLYGQWREGPLWVDGQVAYGANHVSTSRAMDIGEVSRTATDDYWTQTLGAAVKARYEFELAHNLHVGPVAGLDVGWTGHGGAVETGAGALNQTLSPAGAWKIDTRIGVAALRHATKGWCPSRRYRQGAVAAFFR